MSTETVAKHTPGPWKVGEGNVVLTEDCPTNNALAVSPIYCVAACNFARPQDRDYEREANARLVSAAPELYEALQKCLPSTCQGKGIASPVHGKHCGICGYCLGTAAIAKAEGRS